MSAERFRISAVVLSLVGIAIAGYLTYVHVAELQPFCVGGGGGCQKVQASDQAELAGIPVAMLGLAAYAVLLLTSLLRNEAALVVGAVTALAGFGFSAYLTQQSVTVIGATCQWCLASAGVMTLLAGVTTLRLLRS